MTAYVVGSPWMDERGRDGYRRGVVLLTWSFIAAVGFAPALGAVVVVLGVIVAPLGWLAEWWRGPAADDDPEPTREGHRRAAVCSGAAVGGIALGLLPAIAALFAVQTPVGASIGAGIGGGLAWGAIFDRIPPWPGARITPAVVAGAIGAGVGALLGGLVERIG